MLSSLPEKKNKTSWDKGIFKIEWKIRHCLDTLQRYGGFWPKSFGGQVGRALQMVGIFFEKYTSKAVRLKK